MSEPDLSDLQEMIRGGRLDAAAARLNSLLAEHPGDTTALLLQAHVCELEGRWQDAASSWARAARSAPADLEIGSAAALAVIRAELGAPAVVQPVPRGVLAAEPSGAPAPDTDARPDPEEGVDTAADAYGDLDQLIEELEGARIVPNPDVDMMPEEELEDEIQDVVSETLAKIYENQEYFEEAARVYEKLAAQQPENRDEFLKRAAELREGHDGSG